MKHLMITVTGLIFMMTPLVSFAELDDVEMELEAAKSDSAAAQEEAAEARERREEAEQREVDQVALARYIVAEVAEVVHGHGGEA